MGSICSLCCGNSEDDIFEGSENDKTNLLGNPVGEPSRPTSESISNKHIENSGDHHEKLNKILQKTANSYIDVPALNSPLEQQLEKGRDYEAHIQSALQKRTCPTERSSLLEDTPNAERTLSEEPLSESDRKMIKETSSLLLAALQTIQVENTENLVIPFDAPKDKL